MRLRGKVDSESSKREGPGSSNRTVLSQSILAAMFSKTERFEEKGMVDSFSSLAIGTQAVVLIIDCLLSMF